jgi:Icc-related predicted phosphoesterase
MTRHAWLLVPAFLLSTCLRFSPFEIDLSEDEKAQTKKNLDKLARSERAPVSAQNPLVFAFVADTHDGYSNWEKITSLTNARPDVELTLHGGDFTDFGTQQEYRWAYEVFSKLKMPFFAAPGNHDGLAEGADLYAEMFGPQNFDFGYAGIHFLIFNTNTIEWGLSKPDFDWLTQKASEPGYSATFVLTHQPPYSDPDLVDPVSTELKDSVVKLGVSLYLCGHLHEGFGAEQVGSTTFLKVETALKGSWLIVHTDGHAHSYEICNLDGCKPSELPGKADGVDPTPATEHP